MLDGIEGDGRILIEVDEEIDSDEVDSISKTVIVFVYDTNMLSDSATLIELDDGHSLVEVGEDDLDSYLMIEAVDDD